MPFITLLHAGYLAIFTGRILLFRSLHNQPSFPSPPFFFSPPPRPTDPLGCQVFLVQQAIVEATLSAECRPWFLSARGVREFRERNKGRLSLKNEHPCSLSWNSNGLILFLRAFLSLSFSLLFSCGEEARENDWPCRKSDTHRAHCYCYFRYWIDWNRLFLSIPFYFIP